MMKKFLLFIFGLLALLAFLANLVPTALLGLGVSLLYIVFKKFLKTRSSAKKVALVILGMGILCFSILNIHGLIGVAAGYGAYAIYRKLNGTRNQDDPFQHFEKQWAELQRS